MNLFSNLEVHSQSIALISSDCEKITYEELLYQSDKISSSIGGRCLVFLLCANTPDTITGYLGILRASAVPVLLDEGIDHDQLTFLLEKFRPKYIYSPDRTIQDIVDGDRCRIKSVHGRCALLSTNFGFDYIIHDDLAQLMTTSGSTGSPKFVRQSFKNVSTNIEMISKSLKIDSKERAITTMPMSYSYGLSIINTHLSQGASLILNEFSVLERQFWSLLKTYGATTFGGVPYFYKILDKLDFQSMSLPSLKYLTQAGGPLDETLLLKFLYFCNRKHIQFVSMYGQTEASPRMSYLPWNYAFTKAGSIGRPLSGGQFWLVDKVGKVVREENVDGELVYKGDNVCLGYAESCYELYRSDENNGTLYTGDYARRDPDDFYYITGRRSRFVKIFGSRVNLDEIENMIRAAGYECACAGMDDKICIYITQAKKKKEVADLVSARTGIHRTALSVICLKNIPRGKSGKTLYPELN